MLKKASQEGLDEGPVFGVECKRHEYRYIHACVEKGDERIQDDPFQEHERGEEKNCCNEKDGNLEPSLGIPERQEDERDEVEVRDQGVY